jgi:hypothetical protein
LSVGHFIVDFISESHNAVLGTKENKVNTTTEYKLPAVNGIGFTLTPAQAIELIERLASYAKDGKDFEMNVYTQSSSWDSETPVALVGFSGLHKISAELKYAYTGSKDEQVIHYDSTKVGA